MNLESHRRQKIQEGYGAVYHRVYSISFGGHAELAKQVMRELQADLNHCSPQILARFEKLNGSGRELKVGDEFQIHITGPWNGPVRVSDVAEDHFRLVTLEGHLEAGEIEFRLRALSNQEMLFEIESLARSRDGLVDFVYDKIPIAKLAQTEMWTLFCKNFAEQAIEIAQGDKQSIGEVKILTERRDEETKEWIQI